MYLSISFHIYWLNVQWTFHCWIEMRYIFAEFLRLLIHRRKLGNGHSKLSEFFLCENKIPKTCRRQQTLCLSMVLLFGIIKHLLTGYSGNSKFIFPLHTSYCPCLCLGWYLVSWGIIYLLLPSYQSIIVYSVLFCWYRTCCYYNDIMFPQRDTTRTLGTRT